MSDKIEGYIQDPEYMGSPMVIKDNLSLEVAEMIMCGIRERMKKRKAEPKLLKENLSMVAGWS